MRKERLREWYVLGGILTTQLLNGVYFFHSWLDRFQRLDQVATLSSAPTLSFGINSFCQERANHWQVIIWCCHLWKSALGTFDLILPTTHWQGPSIRASHRWGMWDPHGYTSNEQQTAGLTRSPHSVLSTVSGGGGKGEPLGVSERHLLFHGFTKEQDSWKHFCIWSKVRRPSWWLEKYMTQKANDGLDHLGLSFLKDEETGSAPRLCHPLNQWLSPGDDFAP